MKEDCQRWVVLFFNDLQWLIINNYKYLYYMRIYNFSIFAPQTKYKSLKEIAVHKTIRI